MYSRNAHALATIKFQLRSILPIFKVKIQAPSRYKEALLVNPDDC